MSTEDQVNAGVNRSRLLWAGFTAILAAGVGFAIRGGIMDNWGTEYGFTNTQIGAIGGMIASGIIGLFAGAVILSIAYKLFNSWVDQPPPP